MPGSDQDYQADRARGGLAGQAARPLEWNAMTDVELLGKLQSAVAPHVECVNVRGKGLGSFLFIQGKGRAVEASRHQSQWWLECWERQQEDDAPSAKELYLKTENAAVAAIVEWLR